MNDLFNAEDESYSTIDETSFSKSVNFIVMHQIDTEQGDMKNLFVEWYFSYMRNNNMGWGRIFSFLVLWFHIEFWYVSYIAYVFLSLSLTTSWHVRFSKQNTNSDMLWTSEDVFFLNIAPSFTTHLLYELTYLLPSLPHITTLSENVKYYKTFTELLSESLFQHDDSGE